MCGIEIDPVTYQVKVDRYVSMHDAGKILNPLIADGQMRGAFAQGIAPRSTRNSLPTKRARS